MPNPRMITPEILLTQSSPEVVTLSFSKLVTELKINHQQEDPRKTPNTVMAAEE
jgi:hypothetical protein